MRNDLLDAYAATDWANAQLVTLQKRITDFLGRPPYEVIEEDRLESGQKLLKLRLFELNEDSLINAEVGAIINSIRSSLDLLAASLASRNGKTPSSDTHFPIYASAAAFLDGKSVAKREKWFAPKDRAIIENLMPYKGGLDRIYALHQLDITRKHERLVRITPVPSSIVISAAAHAQGVKFVSVWPGFDDGAVIAFAPINATDCDFQIALDVTLDEPKLLPSQPILPLLRDFRRTAELIIEMFDGP